MAAKKHPLGIVYSTDPDFRFQYDEEPEQESLMPGEQDLRIHIQSLKGNKKLTIVRGFRGPEKDLQVLGKKLKSFCGVGGSTKDGEILIQGDQREKILKVLEKDGYKARKSGS